nr:hypothetical protein JVH1_4197 [Rhodococcus sp. JVH1]
MTSGADGDAVELSSLTACGVGNESDGVSALSSPTIAASRAVN